MRLQKVGSDLLAQVDFGLPIIDGISLELDHLKVKVVERAPHPVELVLGLDHHFFKAVLESPYLLLFGQGAKVPLATPVAACAPNPAIENSPALELYRVSESLYEIPQFGLGLSAKELVAYFERDRYYLGGIVVQRSFCHQDAMSTPGQASLDLRRGLLAVKLSEEIFDVLDLEGAGLQGVLLDAVGSFLCHGATLYTEALGGAISELSESKGKALDQGSACVKPSLLEAERGRGRL
jgi:hypothetical protein